MALPQFWRHSRPGFFVSRLQTLLGVLLLALLVASTARTQAQEATSLQILGVDSSQPPLIEATVRLPVAALASPTEIAVALDGVDVGLVELLPARVPGATIIVADLSPRMAQLGAAYASRFQLMQPLASDLVSQLQSSDQRAGLVVVGDQVVVAHPLTNDLGAIANTLARSDPNVLFEPQPLPPDGNFGSYPLGDAMVQALDLLAEAPPEQPRTLVVFAAGDAASVDAAAVTARLDDARAKGRPVELLVYGFAGDVGASSNLAALAAGGTYTPVIVDGQLPAPALKAQIYEQFAAVLQRGALQRLRFSANGAPAGPATLTVRAGGAEASTSVEIAAQAPQVSLFTSSPVLSGTTQLATRIDAAQTPIRRVEYLLDNALISQDDPFLTLLVGDDQRFVFQLDTAHPSFQQRFPPGEYELVAAVEDEAGQSGRSDPQRVSVAAPPAPQGLERLAPLVPGLLGGLVVVVGVGLLLIFLARRGARMASRSQNLRVADQELTRPFATAEEELTAPVALPDEELTHPLELDDERTEPVDLTAIRAQPRWSVEVVDGDVAQRLELKQTKRNYDLGRATATHHPDLALTHRKVSRTHARIELLKNGPVLVAGDALHGTFFGPEKAALAREDRRPLADGDTFWLSPDVELRVKCEGDR